MESILPFTFEAFFSVSIIVFFAGGRTLAVRPCITIQQIACPYRYVFFFGIAVDFNQSLSS